MTTDTMIRPIRTEGDHREALAEIGRLWSAKPGSDEGDRLDVLATLVSAYEDEHHPMPDVEPLDILRYAISDMGRSQAELGQLIGSRSRASEILAGKRWLTLEMVRRVSDAWKIPIEALVPKVRQTA